SPLGSDTQFLTWSIPAKGTEQAGQGPRLSLGAKPSKFNFDVRAPTELGEMRAFIEGDFNGPSGAFRLRHAYGQYSHLLIGQTWSTFSDPYADHEDIDFEGVNGENVVRQAQVRYLMPLPKDLRLALALEYPTASVTGGVAINQIPDLIGRIKKKLPKGHLQGALVLRQIRAQPNADPGVTYSAFAWGVSASGVVFVGGKGWSKDDRFIFQFNGGKGIARYINDLQSCNCGEDAVFGPDGGLNALTAWGFYAAYEHHWENFPNPLKLPLNDFRSSLIWGRVKVDNLSFMPETSYRQTDRVSLNALWSPVRSVDAGIEYIWGQRINEDGSRGTATQLQMRFRFLF
ncbi:MAG: porin, partial [Thermoanaerobaculaceae bacterium]|nr:porin [Thermoanaerobaculaceae bacterium]